jgi:small subunit ribosomal protein S4
MGDPKKSKSKFSGPLHPWREERIAEETELDNEFHFKNRSEIWKLKSKLSNFFLQAKKNIALRTQQSEKEKINLLRKLKALGLLQENADIEDVLGLELKDLLRRRLQSIVFKKDLARSMKQARQFIVHNHITVNGKKVNSPNYLISLSEEGSVAFSPHSSFTDEMHPERVKKEQLQKKPEKKAEIKKEPAKEVKEEAKKESVAEKKESAEKPKKEKPKEAKIEKKPAKAKEEAK